MRILDAQVDVAACRTHREACDRHPLDERKRIALHQHAIGKGARITLVRVAGDELLRRHLFEHGAPLGARREGRAATSAQPRIRDFADDLLRGHPECAAQAGEALATLVIGDVDRVDDTDACAGKPLLPGEPGNLRGRPFRERMRAAQQEPGIEKTRDIARRYRSVRHPRVTDLDLDEGLEPVEAA